MADSTDSDLVRRLRQPFGPTAGPTAVNRIQDMNKQRRLAADRILELEREVAEQKAEADTLARALYRETRTLSVPIHEIPKWDEERDEAIAIAERRVKG